MDRRRFLQVVGAAGAGWVVLDRVPTLRPAGAAPVPPPLSAATGDAYVASELFTDGVMSGDPSAAGFVLWTRVHSELDPGDGAPVSWEVARDPEFTPSAVVAFGIGAAPAHRDHTLRVEVDGLDAGETYFFRFRCRGQVSPVGRTRTAPAPDAESDAVRFAFFSCQRYTHGYFTAHHDLAGMAASAETDLDFVVCLGDYVYNTGAADGVVVPGRSDPVQEAVTLADFRTKYHWYRSDLDLQAVHANYPLVATFDNHDGQTDPDDPQGEGAIAAFFEQMPVRTFSARRRVHRDLAWGPLVDLFMLDSRQYRDPQPEEEDNLLGSSSLVVTEMLDADRTMLGVDQRDWLLDGLAASEATWKFIGSQLMFSPWRSQRFVDEAPPNAGRYLNLQQWDGYQAERRRILAHLDDEEIDNTVVLSGDSHLWSAWQLQVDWDDPDSPYVLTEFGGSSVTSGNADETGRPTTDVTLPFLTEANPQHLSYFQSERHGYGVVHVTEDDLEVTYRSPLTVVEPTSTAEDLAVFRVESGRSRIEQISGA